MSASAHNRLRGRSLYLEVRDVFAAHAPGAFSNHQVRDLLLKRYGSTEATRNLYMRIQRATRQLHADGLLDRAEGRNAKNCPKYTYTYRTDGMA